jgi:hypothetical protein
MNDRESERERDPPPTWKPSDPARWSTLGRAEPVQDGPR